MLRSIEFPLWFIRLDDHKLGIFGIFKEFSLIVVVLMCAFKNKEQLKNRKSPKKLRTMRIGQNLLVLIKKACTSIG